MSAKVARLRACCRVAFITSLSFSRKLQDRISMMNAIGRNLVAAYVPDRKRNIMLLEKCQSVPWLIPFQVARLTYTRACGKRTFDP